MEISMLPFAHMPGNANPSDQAFRRLKKKLREVDQFKKTKVGRPIVTTSVNEAALIEIIEE